MHKYFIPYTGKRPASVVINGHRLVILSTSKALVKDGLHLLGADRVKNLAGGQTAEEDELILSKFADKSRSGLVIAPSDLNFNEVIRNLESELPWVQ